MEDKITYLMFMSATGQPSIQTKEFESDRHYDQYIDKMFRFGYKFEAELTRKEYLELFKTDLS